MVYLAPQPVLWTGRVDDKSDTLTHRWHDHIKCLPYYSLPEQNNEPAVAIVGFACDQGVIRNQGRAGANGGPDVIRKAMANLPIHRTLQMYDVGTVVCENDHLENAHAELELITGALLRNQMIPIIVGGGHDLAKPTGRATLHSIIGTGRTLDHVNFDAHLDMRQPLGQKSTSGTPFYELHQYAQKMDVRWTYCCIGMSHAGNTERLLKTASDFGVTTFSQHTVTTQFEHVYDTLQRRIFAADQIHVSVCLDVFAQAFAPGVSAPAATGILPQHALSLIHLLAQSGKCLAFEIAEMNPGFDHDHNTARLAAALINAFITQIPHSPKRPSAV